MHGSSPDPELGLQRRIKLITTITRRSGLAANLILMVMVIDSE
jgi:hypothetical protein